MPPNDPLSALPGIGEKRAKTLAGMGIHTVGDLLRAYPRDYDDRSEIKTVAMLTPDATNTLRGYIHGEPENIAFASKRGAGKPLIMTKARLRDHTGELELVWFNQAYLQKAFKKETEYVFCGKVKQNGHRLQMESPDYAVWDEQSLTGGRIVPVYTIAKSLSQKVFRTFMHTALTRCGASFDEDLPRAVLRQYQLLDISQAIQNIHFPDSDALFLQARRRLVFEELFFMQSALFRLKGVLAGEAGIPFSDADALPFLRGLPYTLTRAQQSVLYDMVNDLQSGRRMNRLIQGDVGSGKTAVAMAAAYLAVANGYQTAVMAPTEVLARQHFAQFSGYLAGCEVVLLAGSQTSVERKQALAKIESGEAHVVVGTHALIQSTVRYHRLGLVITDEQHRFGVNQRLSLRGKGQSPHTLVMTATPIPRTLGLILYGDMDISVIDELPPGRQAIKTYCVPSGYRERVHDFIRKQVAQGRQAYVVCPAIEESEADTSRLHLSNVLSYTQTLAQGLPGISVACLHGRMKPTEKEPLMADFKANRIQVLVSTTVIEVGVHVANATLMIIENADRFGLSQLHQLRGRVGRGDTQSYCVLVTDSKNKLTEQRMKALCETSDGFRLSELDFKLRGAGDFFGTRQHGLPAFAIANLYRDMEILKQAQQAAVDVARGAVSLDAHEKTRYTQRLTQVLQKTQYADVM